jgi:rubrerythrin
MKIKVYVLMFAVVLAALFSVTRSSARQQWVTNVRTNENLSTAMHGEAFAHAKYLLYAKQAQRNGHADLARLFEETANVERSQHFAEEAALAGAVRSDTDNLRDAIKGESYEADTMYREFADQARASGDPAAVDRFEEVRRDEMAHRDAFKAALAKLEKEVATKR